MTLAYLALRGQAAFLSFSYQESMRRKRTTRKRRPDRRNPKKAHDHLLQTNLQWQRMENR